MKIFGDEFSKAALLPLMLAAMVIVLVGMTSSAVLVFQAAEAFKTSAGSWLGSLCVGMGLLSIFFSLKYRVPVLIAWSTAGSVLLASSAEGFTVNQAIGAFIFSASMIFIFGITGWFEKILNKIPTPLCSALLAGVLLHYCLDTFTLAKSSTTIVVCMLLSYLIGRKYNPRLTMLFVTITGLFVAFLNPSTHTLFSFHNVQLSLTNFQATAPEFSVRALISLGLPLFIVTMASQNLTGLAVLKSHGYKIPVSSTLSTMGITGILTAFFGGFAINFSALTAAIAMGKDVHPDKNKRYLASVISGALYVLIGLCADSIMSIFAAFPKEVLSAIAGFALLPTVSSNLESAINDDKSKESSFLTFLIAASGVSFAGIGSAFWSILLGMCAQLFFDFKNKKA